MLVIQRNVGERVRIGPDVWVEVRGIDRGKVSLGITAPREVEIMREELLGRERTQEHRGQDGTLPHPTRG